VCLSLVAGIALVCVLVLRRSGCMRPKGRYKAGDRDAPYEEPAGLATRYGDVEENFYSSQSFRKSSGII